MACKVLLLVLLLAGIFLRAPSAMAAGLVEETRTEVTAVHGALPPLIARRMEASVKTIADQLLAGQTLDRVQAERQQYEALVQLVFDKILVGYTVLQVEITPDTISGIHVELAPWSETIQQMELDVRVEGMPPEIAELAKRDLDTVQDVFSAALLGLPVDATDWTNGVLKNSLHAFMEKKLPEFWADFTIDTGAVTKIHLSVYPKGPVIRTIDLNMRSDTMPNLLLLNYRPQLQSRTDLLLGVPIAFVERHAEYFKQEFKNTLDQQSDFRNLKMHTAVEITPGALMLIVCHSDSEKYRLRLEGRMDIGRSGDNAESTSFNAYAGAFVSKKDALFLQAEFYPQDVRSLVYGGYLRRLTPRQDIFGKYELQGKNVVVGGFWTFDPRWMLRYEYHQTAAENEWAVRYRLHDFVSLEYIIEDKDSWLRLIGNF